ncbi:MAG TPA: MFS transporter [Gaiellaceae bacterium]
MDGRELFGALRVRRFRLLWLGQATSTLGDGLVPVALSFAVIGTLNRSATALGVVLAAHILPLVLFVLAGGVWADRLPRQLVMLVSDVIRGAVQATMAVLLLTGAAELWHLVVLIAVYGTAEAFFQPAATGLVPATISPQRLQQANALLGLSRSMAFVVGPAVAGVIAATTNPGIVFIVDAATFAVSATSLALLRLPRSRREGERHSFLADLKGGWHELVTHTWLWVIVVWASTFLCLVIAPFLTLGPVIAKESLGGAAAWGIIAAGWGAGSLGGGLLALRWKPARPMLACTIFTLPIAPAVALLALRAPAPVIAVAQAVGGLGMGLFGAVWQTTLQQHVREDALSRVSAWDWMGSFAFLPLGFILAGPVSRAIGISTTLWISVGYLIVSTLAVLLVPSVRNLRRLDEPEREPEPEAVLARLPGEPAEAFHGS